MKHTFFTLLAMLITLSGYAAVENTDFFSQDFIKMAELSDYPTDGWFTLGNGAKPTEYAANYFNADGSGPYYALLSYGEITMAMANTEFIDGTEADEWLISPAIEIPYDNAALLFTACAFANKGQGMGVGANTFKVLVSDTGVEKEDFKEVIIDTNVHGSASTEVTTKKLVAPINGYKDKKIHIAFVVTGSNVGMTGFTNLRMGQYILDATNYTPEVEEVGSTISVDVNIGLKTPVECNFVDVVLSIDGSQIEEREYKKTFGSPTSYIMQMQRIIFEDVILLNNDTPVKYTLTITPRFEGAISSVVTGNVSTPGATYPSNVVIEEFTATGCGWCPRGSAALEYYKDNYNKPSSTQGIAIPIAVHGYMEYYDPMNEGVSDYLTRAQGLNGTAALPGAIFNRITRGLDPSYKTAVEHLIGECSYNTASISEVEVPAYRDMDDLIGKEITVNFNVRNGFNTTSRPLNATAVLIENDVTGFNSGYNQQNYYADYTEQQVTELHGSFIVPYLKPYIAGGDLNFRIIPYSKMTYQHVARGIYPDFFGKEIATEWKSDVAQDFNITFQIPATVTDLKNTEVVILILDPTTNAIVASDIMPASKYTSGINDIYDDPSTSVIADGSSLNIEAPAGSIATLCTIDGIKIAEKQLSSNNNTIAIDSKGLIIVSLRLPDGSVSTHKIIM